MQRINDDEVFLRISLYMVQILCQKAQVDLEGKFILI